MKLATVKLDNKLLTVAKVGEHSLFSLNGIELPSGKQVNSTLDIIASGPEGLKLVRHHLEVGRVDEANLIPDNKVTWLPPIQNPGKICGVAMNNSASNSRKIKSPNHPAFFLKPSSCLIGHEQEIVIRTYYGSVHPEPELAVIIGKKTKDILPENVPEHLFGFSIFNDITGNGMRAKDLFHYHALYPDPENPNQLQKVEQHLSYAARYKGSDTFGVLGPWIVTTDEIDNPDDLDVFCSIGDEVISADSTRYYNYKIAEVISYLSYFHTLNAGDVISMGTAFKPGATRRSIHHANFLEVGGPVSVQIQGLGYQSNPVRIDRRALGRWRLEESK